MTWTRRVLLLLLGGLAACREPGGESMPGPESERDASIQPAQYVGRKACQGCHAAESEQYAGSDHDLAMDMASDATVLGDFNGTSFTHFGVTSRFHRKDGKFLVFTEGTNGGFQEFEIRYVFGARPLQQYLVEFPDGRIQALPFCWDTRPKEQGGQRWFHIYGEERIAPDDILFWTRTSQNWNHMCAECHSTNLRKNYDPRTGRYRTSWSEIDVSCEACHGPASRHVAWAEALAGSRGDQRSHDNGLAIHLKEAHSGMWLVNPGTGTAARSVARGSDLQVQLCARCHARRSLISEEYVHGGPLLDTHFPAVLEEDLYYADGQILDEVYEYGSFLQSKMYRAGVVCSDCHDPHSGQVRAAGNALCFQCHSPEKFGSPDHHFHRAGSKGARCIECHMATRTYMTIDPRRDHSFRVPRPDLTEKIGTPNACTNCHRDRSAQWAARAVERRRARSQPREKHYGETLWAARRGDPRAQVELLRLAGDRSRSSMVRATALTLLPQHPTPAALDALRLALRDPEPLIRATAIRSLDAWPVAERAGGLTPLLRDPVRGVRTLSARSLASARPESLTPEESQSRERVLAEYIQTQLVAADTPAAHLDLGTLFLDRGQQAQAEAAYRKAIDVEPAFMPAYLNLADLYRVQGKENEARAVLLEGLERNPNVGYLHHALGLLLARVGERERAMNSLSRAVRLDPGEARFSYVYAIALNSAGDSAQAIATLEEAVRHHPFDRDLLLALATIHRDRGEIEAARSYAAALAAGQPEDPRRPRP